MLVSKAKNASVLHTQTHKPHNDYTENCNKTTELQFFHFLSLQIVIISNMLDCEKQLKVTSKQ